MHHMILEPYRLDRCERAQTDMKRYFGPSEPFLSQTPDKTAGKVKPGGRSRLAASRICIYGLITVRERFVPAYVRRKRCGSVGIKDRVVRRVREPQGSDSVIRNRNHLGPESVIQVDRLSLPEVPAGANQSPDRTGIEFLRDKDLTSPTVKQKPALLDPAVVGYKGCAGR